MLPKAIEAVVAADHEFCLYAKHTYMSSLDSYSLGKLIRRALVKEQMMHECFLAWIFC